MPASRLPARQSHILPACQAELEALLALPDSPILGFATADCGFQPCFDAPTVKVPSGYLKIPDQAGGFRRRALSRQRSALKGVLRDLKISDLVSGYLKISDQAGVFCRRAFKIRSVSLGNSTVLFGGGTFLADYLRRDCRFVPRGRGSLE
jgi:hypothetical protein